MARERKRRTAASYLSKWINVHHKSPNAMPHSQKAKKKRRPRCWASGKWTMASRTLSVRHSQSAICPPSLNPFMIHRETDSKLAHWLTSMRMYTRSCLGASHARQVLRSSNQNGIGDGRAFCWHSGRLILWTRRPAPIDEQLGRPGCENSREPCLRKRGRQSELPTPTSSARSTKRKNLMA